MSHRHHHTDSQILGLDWNLYKSSLLGGNKDNRKSNNNDKKRYKLDQGISEPHSKRSRTSGDRLPSMHKASIPTLTSATTSTPRSTSIEDIRTTSTLYQQQLRPEEDYEESIEAFLERTELSTHKISSTKVRSLYQQQQQDSDESTDTYLERTEHRSSMASNDKNDKWRTVLSLYQQPQEEDSDALIDTYFGRAGQQSSTRSDSIDWKRKIGQEGSGESMAIFIKNTRHKSKAAAPYQQPQEEDSDVSIDTYLDRTGQQSSRRSYSVDGKRTTGQESFKESMAIFIKDKQHENKATLYQQSQEEDSDESIDTYLDRTGQQSLGRSYSIGIKRKTGQESTDESMAIFTKDKRHDNKATSYQQSQEEGSDESINTYLGRIERRDNDDTDIPQSNSSTIDSATSANDDYYTDLFGKRLHLKRAKSTKQKNGSQQQRVPKETSKNPPSIDMKDLLEAITLEPLPEADTKEELDFFFGNQTTLENNKQTAKHGLVNGFTGFSDYDSEEE